MLVRPSPIAKGAYGAPVLRNQCNSGFNGERKRYISAMCKVCSRPASAHTTPLRNVQCLSVSVRTVLNCNSYAHKGEHRQTGAFHGTVVTGTAEQARYHSSDRPLCSATVLEEQQLPVRLAIAVQGPSVQNRTLPRV